MQKSANPSNVKRKACLHENYLAGDEAASMHQKEHACLPGLLHLKLQAALRLQTVFCASVHQAATGQGSVRNAAILNHRSAPHWSTDAQPDQSPRKSGVCVATVADWWCCRWGYDQQALRHFVRHCWALCWQQRFWGAKVARRGSISTRLTAQGVHLQFQAGSVG